MTYYSQLEGVRKKRQLFAEKLLDEYRSGRRSKRSVMAYLREGAKLWRIPSWIEDEEGYAACQDAAVWLSRCMAEGQAVASSEGLTDAMERGGAIDAAEANRRREIASFRHNGTDYDSLLRRGYSRDEARSLAMSE